MADEFDNVTADEAHRALDSVANMESAGYRRAVPPRWFGVGIALLIASLFALYALEDPHPYVVFPIVGLGVLITIVRDKSGAYGRDFPVNKAHVLAFVLFIAVMILVFFGSVIIRRAYDAAWAPVVAGLLVGIVVFLASESERRFYLAKTDEGEVK